MSTHFSDVSSNQISRRELMMRGAALSAGAYFTLKQSPVFGDTVPEAPHFFLQIFIPGGVDPTYLFDARPLQMTSEKLITNYLGKDPVLYAGTNGGTCLRTELTDPLMTHSSYFSVINGVMMSSSFDGHPENESYFLSGQPLGAPMLFQDVAASHPSAITAVRLGMNLGSEGRNPCDGMLKLTNSVGRTLTQAIKQSGAKAFEPSAMGRLTARLQYSIRGQDSRSNSKRKFRDALAQVPSLQERLGGLTFAAANPNGAPGAANSPATDIQTLLNLFKGGITNAGMYVFSSQDIDVHSPAQAKKLPQTLKPIIGQLAEIFTLLRSMSFDESRSMLDVTTVVIGSEFGRTMRQSADVENSGTDHNPLTNSVIVAGKGIKAGFVIGASDLKTVESFKSNVSKAHLAKDPSKLKIMAKPFEFESGGVKNDLPESFDLNHYLTIGSVINTVYSSLGVPKERWRKDRATSPVFPVLSGLTV